MKAHWNLDWQDSEQLIAAAVQSAESVGVPQNIAVVDARGDLIAFRRMDGAKSYTVDFAILKAQTAAGTGAKTEDLGKIALPGERGFGLSTLKNGDVAVVGGGIPVLVRGRVVGAIGVSSGSVSQDIHVAEEAVREFELCQSKYNEGPT